MAITRKDLVDLIRPEIEHIFDGVYREAFNQLRLVMPRRGRYQIWRGHHTLVIDRIKYRKEALALIKLIRGNEE
jgi:hypothetical protein